jgi:hypothetical protein
MNLAGTFADVCAQSGPWTNGAVKDTPSYAIDRM